MGVEHGMPHLFIRGSRAEDKALTWLVECLPSLHETLGSLPALLKLHVRHLCDPCTRELEAE